MHGRVSAGATENVDRARRGALAGSGLAAPRAIASSRRAELQVDLRAPRRLRQYRRPARIKRLIVIAAIGAGLTGCGGPSHNRESSQQRRETEAARVQQESEQDSLHRPRWNE
jgi:hypothetical protein